MSKIIKGGGIRFFSLDLSRASDGEEQDFSPLSRLLPEEVWQDLERVREQEGDRQTEDPLPVLGTETLSKDTGEISKEDLPDSQGPEPDSIPAPEEIDPLSLPGVAERLALLEQEAYEKGFAQGQKDGMELGRQQYESMAARLKDLVQGLEEEIERHVLALEKPVFELVKLMAEKVIHKEISLGPQVLTACIREALTHVVEQSRVRLHLNPEDVEYMEEVLQELAGEFSKVKDFELVPDENVARGGCLLETDFGLVDATYERKWREILRRLEE